MNTVIQSNCDSMVPADRILVLKWSAMGDLAIASCAFEDIRNAYPEAQITLDTLPPWQQLYEQDPRFDHLQCFDLRRGGVAAARMWLRAAARARYDLVLDLQTTDRSRAMIGIANWCGRTIPYRAGNRAGWPYNLAPPNSLSEPRDALQIARGTLAAAGIPAKTDVPWLYASEDLIIGANALLDNHGLSGQRFAVFLPGCQAAGYLKRWGTHNYARLAERLVATHVDRIVLLGGPDEVKDCQDITAAAQVPVTNLCGQTALLQIAPICAQATVVVANDTGTAHLAAAADIPMVVVCGPTDPRRVLPAGPRVRAAQVELPCINCYRKTCAHHSCMRLLMPERVMLEVARALQTGG